MADIHTTNDAQIAALLNLYEYLDYHGGTPGMSMSDLISRAEREIASERNMADYAEKLDILKQALTEVPGFADLKLGPSQHGYSIEADSFYSSDKENVYVAYRGTGDEKWLDNGRGMTEEITTSQQDASDFFDRVAESLGIDQDTNVVVTGHSKGGNNAQTATLNAENRAYIDKCYSFDGQGFSDAAVERYENMIGYEDQRSKIYSINGKDDPVNELGIKIARDENTVYIETNMDTSELEGSHGLEYLFYREDGTFGCSLNEATEQGPLGEYAALLSEYIMSLPEDARDACAVSIMQLIEICTGGNPIGYDGDHATFQDLKVLLDEGLPWIFYSLIGTEEGRDLVIEMLKDLVENYLEEHSALELLGVVIATISFAPIVFAGAYILGELVDMVVTVLALVEKVKEIIDEVKAYIGKCLEKIEEFLEEVGEWLNHKITGRPVIDEGDFSVDVEILRDAGEVLKRMQRRMMDAASDVQSIKRSLPMSGAVAGLVKNNLNWTSLRLCQTANSSGKLGNAVTSAAGTYVTYERRIAANAPSF